MTTANRSPKATAVSRTTTPRAPAIRFGPPGGPHLDRPAADSGADGDDNFAPDI
jgi:hypothetical protein